MDASLWPHTIAGPLRTHSMSSAAGAHISQIMAFRRIARQRRPPGTPSFVLQRFLSPALQLELLHHSAVESDAATDRRTVMRPSTIPILAAVAFSLAVPSNADARPRFGPAVLLGVVAGSFGAMFGGFRHSSRHHRRSATHASVGQRSTRAARMERRAALSAHRPAARAPAAPTTAPPAERTAPVAPEQAAALPPDQTAALPPERAAPIPPERTAAIFWPDAARDLVEYVLLPAGNDRFWAYGYDAIVQGAFAPSDVDDRRGPRNRPAAN